MRLLAMLTPRFTVIGGDNDQRPHALGVCQQRRQRAVGIGDLASVWVVAVLLVERRRRQVRRMGIVDMHPGKPGVALASDPAARDGNDCGRRSLWHQITVVARTRDEIVICIEALRQAETRVERKRADEGAGGITFRLQAFCPGVEHIADTKPVIVVHAVPARVEAREDRGMRRQRHDGMRHGVVEADPSARQGTQRRRLGAPAVGAESVLPQCVDGDQQHRWARYLGRTDAGHRTRQHEECPDRRQTQLHRVPPPAR